MSRKETLTALSSAEALRQYRRKHVKRKKRSLCHIMCGSRQKSRGSWHLQRQQRFRFKENLCSDTHVILGFIMETRGREQSWELLRVQTTLSDDWNYKILKIDQSIELLDTEGKKVSFLIRPVCVALGHPYDIILKKRSRPDPNSIFYTHPCSTLGDLLKV